MLCRVAELYTCVFVCSLVRDISYVFVVIPQVLVMCTQIMSSFNVCIVCVICHTLIELLLTFQFAKENICVLGLPEHQL